jgi:predicted GIY-YIG superfamily endonuclease
MGLGKFITTGYWHGMPDAWVHENADNHDQQGVYIQDVDDDPYAHRNNRSGNKVYNVGQTVDYRRRYRRAERQNTIAFYEVSDENNLAHYEQQVMDMVQARGGELSRKGRAKSSKRIKWKSRNF